MYLYKHLSRSALSPYASSPTCNCGLEDQTAEHILQSRYPFLQTARTNLWPTAVQLRTKFYGSKEELEKTATVIFSTDWTLSVAAIEKTERISR